MVIEGEQLIVSIIAGFIVEIELKYQRKCIKILNISITNLTQNRMVEYEIPEFIQLIIRILRLIFMIKSVKNGYYKISNNVYIASYIFQFQALKSDVEMNDICDSFILIFKLSRKTLSIYI